MNRDIRPSWRRTWADRHPVLYETLGVILATAGVWLLIVMLLYAST